MVYILYIVYIPFARDMHGKGDLSIDKIRVKSYEQNWTRIDQTILIN